MNITRKSRIISIITACLLCAVSACSCSGSNVPISPESSNDGDGYSDIFSNPDNLSENSGQSEISEVSEVEISVAQEADENQTVFKVDSVLDVGVQTDDGMKYIYPLVTIKNSSDTDYNLSSLNNISVLLDDGTEVHYDIRTQLYADDNNIENYLPKVITVPAGGEVSGYAGGFIVPDGTDSFTVCFYPTQNDPKNKGTVIKCPISAENIETK